MNTSTLCTLLAQRIPPEQFQLWGLEIHWTDEKYNNEVNRAIVEDVITNYDTLEKEYHNKTAYILLRAREYPPITNYIDGIVKGDQAQIDQYIADCLAVKNKYPKS